MVWQDRGPRGPNAHRPHKNHKIINNYKPTKIAQGKRWTTVISSKNPTELQHGEGRVEESGLRPGASPQRNLTTRGKESRGTPQASALCMFAAFATEVTHAGVRPRAPHGCYALLPGTETSRRLTTQKGAAIPRARPSVTGHSLVSP